MIIASRPIALARESIKTSQDAVSDVLLIVKKNYALWHFILLGTGTYDTIQLHLQHVTVT